MVATSKFRVRVRRGNGALILCVLIAMAIILYLMFGNMGGTTYMTQVKKTRDNGRETARQIRTEQMTLLIAMYRQTNSKLPTTPADLESPGTYNDSWGKEMTFTFEVRNGKTMVKYHSAGPDGEFKTADDVDYTDTIPY
ncbi:MAG: hypothetical protein JSR77_00980 [Planctomycetes bacterium]|nr:hypothetical protein [Planctomycetota bacterium]